MPILMRSPRPRTRLSQRDVCGYALRTPNDSGETIVKPPPCGLLVSLGCRVFVRLPTAHRRCPLVAHRVVSPHRHGWIDAIDLLGHRRPGFTPLPPNGWQAKML